jgi:predicted deacetylase
MPGRPSSSSPQTIAVALHGIEPATFERCAVIRDWLDDHGVDRVTLLVIPARDLHPVGERSPEMVEWLSERRAAGDSIAQHGFQHVRLRPGSSPRRMLARVQGHRLGEFAGLDGEETRRAVHAGWRVLKLAGIEPDGFVAPAYAYTSALRRALGAKFRWWAGLLRLHRAPAALGAGGRDRSEPGQLAPAWSLAAAGPLTRLLSPPIVRVGAMLPTSTLRLDVHPTDLRHQRHMMALEWALERSASRRTAVTYEDLAGGGVLAPPSAAAAHPDGLAVNIDGSSGLTAGRAA